MPRPGWRESSGNSRVNPSAARSLEEGMEETHDGASAVHRRCIGELLRRSLATANPVKSCLSTVGKSSAQRETLAQR